MHPSKELQVGMIGLGNIGSPMALNILKAGIMLSVVDLDPSATEAAVRSGAHLVPSPGALADECNVICVAVVDDDQVQSVLYGADGVFGHVVSGTVVLIHSTVRPLTCSEAADRFAARGAAVLDAPVTGAEMAAKAGTLTVLVGGDSTGLERVRPVLEAVGSRIIQFGEAGMGQVAKIVNNLMVGLNLLAVSEGLRLGAAAGIENEQMLEAVAVGSGDSWAARNWEAMVRAASTYPTGPEGMTQLMLKDLNLALDMARASEVRLPITALATQLGGGLLEQ